MGMADENGVDFFPAEVHALERDLCALAAVEQEEVSIAPNQGRGEVPVGQRHGTTGTQDEDFEAHRGIKIAETRTDEQGVPSPDEPKSRHVPALRQNPDEGVPARRTPYMVTALPLFADW
jgi:hypothetical protein